VYRSYLLLIFICNILICNEIILSPFAYYRYYANGGDLQPEIDPIKWSGLGGKVFWQPNDWLMITSSVSANGVWGFDYEADDLIDIQGLTYYRRYYDSAPDLAAYWTSEVDIRIKTDNNEYSFSNVPRQWGEGLSPIILSNKAPNYPTIGFVNHFGDNLKFSYFYGNLDINHQGNQDSDLYGYYVYKSISAHKLEYHFTNAIEVNLYELVIYDRALELNYINPFMAYYPISRYLGKNDNSQLGIEFIYHYKTNKYFISLFIDEWNIEDTFKPEHQNWMTYKIGISYNDMFKGKNQLNVEYTWSDYRVYGNINKYLNYYSNGYPLGFWAGPHSEEYRIDYKTKFGSFDIHLNYLDIKRGKQTDQMVMDAYEHNFNERYFNGYEHKKIISSFFTFELINNLSTAFQIGYVQWENAGFDPYSDSIGSLNGLKDVDKIFFSLDLYFSYENSILR